MEDTSCNQDKALHTMKDLLKQNKGAVAVAACLFSVSAVHAQTVQLYNAQTGAFISQSSFSTLSGGAWNGQALPTGNVLDVWTSGGVAAVMLMDPNGSLSSYRLDTGALIADYTPTTFANGPYAGMTLAANRNNIMGGFISTAGVAYVAMLDPNGTTSQYRTDTLGVGNDFSTTTLTGGPHAGQTFNSTFSLNIGGIDAINPSDITTDALLDSDGSISYYNMANGTLVGDPSATTLTGGLLDGQSFASLLGKPGTENQPGVTYLGIDYSGAPYVAFYVNPVPEPGSIALFSIGGLFAGYHLIRRRK